MDNNDPEADPAAGVHRFVFLLLDRFSLIAFACSLEPLRLANRQLGYRYYEWVLASLDGASVTCSAGTSTAVDCGLCAVERDDTVIVCGGIAVQQATSRPLISWLRKVARKGAAMGALCTGSHALAAAGLLDGRRATIHWENQDAFLESFEEVELERSVFVIDGNRYTSAGGTATLDMMLRLIAADLGQDVAGKVADQMIYSAIRTEADHQRLSVPTRIGVRHPKLSAVVRQMEANIEEPVSPAELARQVGMSTRQLERLFRRYLNRSPKRYYMQLRLQKARNLLMQTDMSVINVALACGFTSPSHFSKCYRAHYATTPYRERGAQGAQTP